jgi:L-fuculose-phosphate aldolase
MGVVVRDKAAYHQQTEQRMDRHFESPGWSMRQKLALACRILAAEGHDSGLAGQLTARGPKPGTYYMLRFGLGWIYRARAAVSWIMHTHPPHISALSMIGVPLAVSHMDTSLFFEDCAWLREWPGTPIGDEEGRIISEALGDKKAILLAHHGQLTATASVEHALVLAMFVERAAKLQLMAMSAGTILPVDPALAQEAHDYRHEPKAIGARFAYYSRRVLKQDATVLD